MDYKPNEGVLAKLPQVTFVAIIGPTAAGKTTLMNAAAARCPALHPVVTVTSRPARPGEEDGVDFHFRERQEIEAKASRSEFVTIVPGASGDLYATAAEDYSAEGIVMLAVMARVMPVFQALPFKAIRSIFVLPPSWEIWQQRVLDHNFTPEQYEKRMVEAGDSLRYAIENQDVLFVINDDLAQASVEFTQAALGAMQAADQFKSRELAATLLKELQNR